MKRNYRLLMVGVVVCAVFALFLMFTTMTTSHAVLTPSEVVAAGNRYLGRLRIAGRVSSDSIGYQVTPEFRLEFFVEDRPADGQENGGASAVTDQPGKKLKVVFEDIKPDMFTNGRDVLIDGQLEDGTVIASSILTQCPSKYEPKDGVE
jgi:cytochrome c-type biogenesis protein CcmE